MVIKKKNENRDVFNVFLNYLLWIVLFFGVVFGYVYQSIKVADMEFMMKQLNKQIAVLENKKKQLETEAVFLSSPERIGKYAETKLKLVTVNDSDIVWINVPKRLKKMARAD